LRSSLSRAAGASRDLGKVRFMRAKWRDRVGALEGEWVKPGLKITQIERSGENVNAAAYSQPCFSKERNHSCG